MARATDLPIYRDAYELLLLITRLAQQYPRGYRQGLARDVCLESQALVTLVFQANCTTEKTPIIERLREQLQVLQLQMRLSKDLRLISACQLGATAALLDAIGKQASGWLKYARKSA
jgi:hypothetical protein